MDAVVQQNMRAYRKLQRSLRPFHVNDMECGYYEFLQSMRKANIRMEDGFGVSIDYVSTSEDEYRALRRAILKGQFFCYKSYACHYLANMFESQFFEDHGFIADLRAQDTILALAKLRIHPQRIADHIPARMYEEPFKAILKKFGMKNILAIIETTRPKPQTPPTGAVSAYYG